MFLAGCQTSYLAPEVETQWQQQPAATPEFSELQNWLQHFSDPQLNQLVDKALAQNLDLQQSLARVRAAEQQAIISGATRLPAIDLNGSGQRQKLTTGNFSENYGTDLQLSWEVDLWGKLSDSAQAGKFELQAEQATLESARLSLAGQVAKAWFDLQTEQRLLQLFQERVSNLTRNLEIIESGYRQGINSALDLYLARSDLASEKSQLHNQSNARLQAIRTLEILLGQHPSGDPAIVAQLPTSIIAPASLPQDIPLAMVFQRHDLQASYSNLLAADREVAVAHKARYPGLRISAAGGDSSNQFGKLFDQSSLTWSVLGSITQPIFAGGSLKAQQQKKQFELQQKEQQFLQDVLIAYQEIYNGLDTEKILQQQLQELTAAEDFAEAAQSLSFEEYQQGLQDYTTVLESQRRAFAAQSEVINVRNTLLKNRINFYLATGSQY
ncbi:MAG: AdeC/AdeK/OprM family multidrug efflux complex outer membrane factor [Candidatus Pelagadaptatus aseana]